MKRILEIQLKHHCGDSLAESPIATRKLHLDLDKVISLVNSGIDAWGELLSAINVPLTCTVCNRLEEIDRSQSIFALTYERVPGPESNPRVMFAPIDVLKY